MHIRYARPCILLASFTLTACASTGVVPTGNNEYMVSKTDLGDVWHEGSKVLAELYVEGNDYCERKGLALEKVSEETQDGRVFVRNASATLRFRCVERR